MNADKHRWLNGIACMLLIVLTSMSTMKAEDVEYQLDLNRLTPEPSSFAGTGKNIVELQFPHSKELTPLQLLIPSTSRRILVPAPGKHVLKPFSWKIPGKDEAKALYWSLLAHSELHRVSDVGNDERPALN